MFSVTYVHTRPDLKTPFFYSADAANKGLVSQIEQAQEAAAGYVDQVVSVGRDALSVYVTVRWDDRFDWVVFQTAFFHLVHRYRAALKAYEAKTGCTTTITKASS